MQWYVEMKDLKRAIPQMGILLAVAVLAGYIEMIIPADLLIPGVKLGLANSVILFILYRAGFKASLIISILRTVIIAFLFTSPSVLLYSFSAAVVSLIVMTLLRKSGLFSIYGISAAGGIVHNMTQLIIAGVIMLGIGAGFERIIFFYLPILIISGLAAGLFNAFIADILIKRIPVKEDI